MRRLPPWMLGGASTGETAARNCSEAEAPEKKAEKRPRRIQKPKEKDLNLRSEEQPKRGRRKIGEEAKRSCRPEMIQSVTGGEDEDLTVDDLLSFAQEYVQSDAVQTRKERECLSMSDSMLAMDESTNMTTSSQGGTRDSTTEDMLGLLLGPYFKKQSTPRRNVDLNAEDRSSTNLRPFSEVTQVVVVEAKTLNLRDQNLGETKMATSLSKFLTRSNAHIHRSSTATNISTSPSLPRQFWSRHFSAVADTSSSSSAALESQSSSSALPRENKRGFRWSQLLLFLPGAITFGLGSWQIVRREEKFKTLEYQQQRLNMEPMKLNTEYPPDKNLDTLEFRRVSCKGVFDEQRSIYLGPRSRSISGVTENGFYVITPLMPIPGDLDSMQSPILVNRGWVPRSWREKSPESTDADFVANQSTKAKSPSDVQNSWWKFWSKTPMITEEQVSMVKPVEVVGVIRGGENPSIFVPSNDPSTGQWFYVDVPAMARAVGLPENTIYVEDVHEHIDRSRPYPVPKDINTLIRSKVMPQDHLNYSITWYSLSAAVTFMAYKRLKPKPARR